MNRIDFRAYGTFELLDPELASLATGGLSVRVTRGGEVEVNRPCALEDPNLACGNLNCGPNLVCDLGI